MKLIRLERNYSSWSLRAYLMLRQTGQPFEEVAIPVLECDHYDYLREHCPAQKVPVLHVDGLVLWESLAIGEFLHERYGLYPKDWRQRALARCISHESHAGFAALRGACRRDMRGRPSLAIGPEVQRDLDRIGQIWSDCLSAGGPFLFGEWCLADAMYAPVATRLRTYGLSLGPHCDAYRDRVLEHPFMLDWCAGAELEQTVVEPGLHGPRHVARR